jgi:hypothetical protein
MVLPHPDGVWREFSIFCPKKRDFRKFCKSHAINISLDPCRPRKNVLTAKKGLFLGVLAGKRGAKAMKKAFYFSRFGDFFRLQVVVRQPLADSGRLQKKSCRKTYRRFFNSREL